MVQKGDVVIGPTGHMRGVVLPQEGPAGLKVLFVVPSGFCMGWAGGSGGQSAACDRDYGAAATKNAAAIRPYGEIKPGDSFRAAGAIV